ncbi:MAG: transposase [Sulfobacillus acidophilus]|uniref:Transposase n=1 Tax=Sulfobacillus acidophilus TaxID=53633 RepID=A0A2T2WDJ3_9FIRM|nr:MAG: transposase [Sulfobacillus acidophilus]
MRQSFKYRLYPNKAQQQMIEDTLEHCRLLYNRLLAERKEAYEKSGTTLSYVVQANSFPARKAATPALAAVHSQVLQDVAKRLDKAFQAFFRRVKHGETPGYPRFKPFGRYHSFTYPQGGYQIRDQRLLHLSKIGDIKIKLHRPIEGTIKTCTLVAKNGKYYAVFSCEVEAVPLPSAQAMMGGDLGIKHLLVTSDGECFDHPQSLRKAERKLKRLQRAVSRKKKGSRRRQKAVRRLAKAHEHVANQWRNAAHQIARYLVNTDGLIAFEELNAQGLLKNHYLAKSIADAGWHQLVQFTTDKAESAGRRVVLVDPRYTSQDCSTPGCTYRKTDLTLADRLWECPRCGVWHDRDINAAQNILQRALVG